MKVRDREWDEVGWHFRERCTDYDNGDRIIALDVQPAGYMERLTLTLSPGLVEAAKEL